MEALPYARHVTRISPNYVEGLIYYADILIHNGRSREAIPYFDKGIRLTPDAPQLGFYQWLRGEALMHHGNFVEAEKSLVEANRVFQGGNQALLHFLAGARLRLGKLEEAMAALEQAKALGSRSIGDNRDLMEFISADDGGEYWKGVWADLKRLSTSTDP